MASKKTIKLTSNNQNHKIVAISSHENDYRLSWAINEQLNWSLSRSSDIDVHIKRTGENCNFSRYEFLDEDNFLRFQLISNTADNAYFFDELKSFDYILLITGEGFDNNVDSYLNMLRDIPIINLVHQIEIKAFRNREFLDLE
jgi:hypothetical protein